MAPGFRTGIHFNGMTAGIFSFKSKIIVNPYDFNMDHKKIFAKVIHACPYFAFINFESEHGGISSISVLSPGDRPGFAGHTHCLSYIR
jgi:hypothetical protein